MSRFKTVAFAALAVIALSGLMAGAAQAKTPFWTVEGAKLAKGALREVVLKLGVSELNTSIVKLQCGGGKAKAGAVLTGGLPGGAKGVIEYEKCVVVGESNGKGCKLEKEIISTETLVAKLVTKSTTTLAKDKILAWFKPETGSAFIKKIAFSGAECKFKETSVEGSNAGEVLDNTKANVTVEGNEPEPESGFVNSPGIGEVSEDTCTEKEGKCEAGSEKMTAQKPSLKAFGLTAILSGSGEVTLTKKGKFGAKTK